MAGMGKRLRPHTLVTPKPLLKIAGKSIVERLVEDICTSVDYRFTEIHFVIGDFGSMVEKELLSIAESFNAKGFLHYQEEALGTAHAIYCAESALQGNVIIAFADTLFKGNFKIDSNVDGIIWTMEVSNPEKYGVVVYDEEEIITEFIEKPEDRISNRAIIGIYYFKEGEKLAKEIKYLIDNNLRENNEYQLTNCLESLKEKGDKIKCSTIEEWLDCGNKEQLLNTLQKYLGIKDIRYESEDKNVNILNPVYIGNNVEIINCTIGPYVSVEDNCRIMDSTIKESIIYGDTRIESCIIRNSIVGNNSDIKNIKGKLDFGDYSKYEN